MSILARVRDAVYSTFYGPITVNHPAVAQYLSDYGPTSTGISVTERSALNYSAVWACVQAIARPASAFPCILYRSEGRNRERDRDDSLYRLLRTRPNSETSAAVFIETLLAHATTWGGAFAEIERNVAGEPIALWQLTPDIVTPFRTTPGGPLAYKVALPGGTTTVLNRDHILHIPGLSFDGINGYSVIGKARESIALGLGMEKFSATFYGNGSTFGGILTHQTPLKSEQVKELQEQIEKKHQGLSKAHRFLILQNGADYKQLGIPMADAQFVESRQFSVVEICRWFGVSPAKVFDLTHGTFSNVEQQNGSHLSDAIQPWLVKFEQELTEKLCKPGQHVEFLVDGYYRADIQTRYGAYAVGIQNGFLTQNECREREGLNPLPGGDVLMKPNTGAGDAQRTNVENDDE